MPELDVASVQIRRTKRLQRLVPPIHGGNAYRARSGLMDLPMTNNHRTRHIEIVQKEHETDEHAREPSMRTIAGTSEKTINVATEEGRH